MKRESISKASSAHKNPRQDQESTHHQWYEWYHDWNQTTAVRGSSVPPTSSSSSTADSIKIASSLACVQNVRTCLKMKQGELVNAKASKMALNVVYSSMQDGYDLMIKNERWYTSVLSVLIYERTLNNYVMSFGQFLIFFHNFWSTTMRQMKRKRSVQKSCENI